MSRGLLIALVLGIAIVSASTAAVAHHAISAEFDSNRPVEFTGKLVKIDWLNPHSYFHVEVEREDGTTVTYKVEGGPPNSMYRSGWRPDSYALGIEVSFDGIGARNPDSTNVNGSLLDSEGNRMFSGQGPAAQ
jgi:hypothetical protein